MKCAHTRAAVCFLCSDQVPWWRAVRVKKGLGERPPNKPQVRVISTAVWHALQAARQSYAERYAGRP